LHRLTEDLYYTYYNIAGHDRQVLVDGARELLAQIWKMDINIGIVTGEAEKIAKLRAEKTTIHGFFKIGAYGEDGKGFDEIVNIAARKAEAELGISKDSILVVGYSPHLIKGAKAAGIHSVGVAGVFTAEELKDAGADLVIKSIKERGKLIGFISKGGP
ncbi:MAG: HAD hydrolase-like protein, partial [Candidatus Micrarchaeaceae archaeon]